MGITWELTHPYHGRVEVAKSYWHVERVARGDFGAAILAQLRGAPVPVIAHVFADEAGARVEVRVRGRAPRASMHYGDVSRLEFRERVRNSVADVVAHEVELLAQEVGA